MAEQIVFFDNECLMCSKFVQWIIAHERDTTVRFANFQSASAKQYNLDAAQPNSIVYVSYPTIYRKSTAFLQLCKQLKAPYNYLGVLRIVPRSIRDGVYDFIAVRRIRFFGRTKEDLCLSPIYKHRILD